MMAAEVSNQSYTHVGVPDAFHPLSHHAENKAAMEKLVDRPALPQRRCSPSSCEKLAMMPDGDGGPCSTIRSSCTAAT